MVCINRSVNNSVDPTEFTPDGWNKIGAFSDSVDQTARHTYFWRISDGFDPNFPFDTSAQGVRRAIALFKPNRPLDYCISSGFTSEATSGNPAAQVQASGASTVDPLIVFGSYAESTGAVVNPRTMSPAKDAEIDLSVSSWHFFAWRVINVGGSFADTTIDMDDEGAYNMLASFIIRCY